MSNDVRKPQTSNRDRKNKGVSPEDAQKPFALYHAEHTTPQSSSTGSRLALEPLLGFYLQEREEERAKAAPSQGSGTHASPVTAAECAVPMSAHTIGSWFKGADWAHVNTVASSTWSSGEGSSADLIWSRPSLLHLQREKGS